MIGRAGFSSKCWRVLRWAGLAAAAPALWACTSRTLEPPNITPTATLTTNFTQKINNEIDILFMIDNSSSMTEMQSKLYDQLPLFMNVLKGLPNPPSLHVAVVSSDMGAPGDSTELHRVHPVTGIGPRFRTCRAGLHRPRRSQREHLHLRRGHDAELHRPDRERVPVHRAPRRQGVRVREPARVDRRRARRRPQPTESQTPSTNVDFLRPEAYLGIVILTNEDDCSAPANTDGIYSLNGGQQNIANPDGPIQNYRCNGGLGAHLCQDPAMGNAMIVRRSPPLGTCR